MFFRIYKLNHPIIIIFIFILGGLIWLPSFFHAFKMESVSFDFEMPFYYWTLQLTNGDPLTTRIISFALILFQAILINRLNTKYFLLESRSYLPAFIFIVSSSLVPMQALHPILFGGVFLLLTINSLLSTYRNDKAWIKFFDAGLLIAIGSLFYLKLVFFLILVWIALFILRPFRGREWLISIIGFILPYAFVASYFFIFEDNIAYKLNQFLFYLLDFNNLFDLNYYYLGYFAFLVLLILFSSYRIIATIQTRKVSVRRFYQLFFWLFLISVVLFSISSYSGKELILIINIAFTYLISNYIASMKSKFWTEVILSLFVGIIVVIQLINYTNLIV